MRPAEALKRELTRTWLRKAEADLKAAERLLSGGPEYAEGVAFHAQQAVEKYLKAFLVWHQVEFPKSHDIAHLLELGRSCDEDMAVELSEAHWLTPFGVAYRYPGDYPEVSLGDAEHALETAAHVRDEVRKRLPRHILD